MRIGTQPLFLFGPGYSARALARLWPGPVSGTMRSVARRKMLQTTNIVPVMVSDTDALVRAIHKAHVIVAAPPGAGGCPAITAIGHLAASAASLTYLSTTAVYGDLGGGWAMEWTPVNPDSDRSRRRVDAELSWHRFRPDVRIVRLAGIYGPGRSALDRLKGGQARCIVKPGQVFNRIHVTDIAHALKALVLSGASGIFNLCDEEAAEPQAVITHAAKLLKMPTPPTITLEQADLSPMARSFYNSCRRVANGRIKSVAGWRPVYRTYREGLAAIHTAADNAKC